MRGASATGRHGVPEGLRAYRPTGTLAYIEGRADIEGRERSKCRLYSLDRLRRRWRC